MTPPVVAIVGGGLGGLLLARILQVNGVASTVYELDASPTARSQGGLLNINEDSGQGALRAAGLYEAFCRLTRPQAEGMRVLDRAGTVYIDQRGEGGRPEIERADLRRLLIGSLYPGCVQWGHKLAGITALGSGRHRLHFTTGHHTDTDLLVGADGTWSKVRPLVSAAVPAYCGVSYLDLRISDAGRRYPALADLVGPGMFFALSDHKALIGHGGHDLHLGASVRVPQDWIESGGVDWSDAQAARRALLAAFADWSPELQELIRSSDDKITPWRIFALPRDHVWERVPGVTLLGDAAHVMSPYAGEGANLALQDAADLALALSQPGQDLEAALTSYETAMFARSHVAAEHSALGLEMCFAADAPQEMVAFFTG